MLPARMVVRKSWMSVLNRRCRQVKALEHIVAVCEVSQLVLGEDEVVLPHIRKLAAIDVLR